MAIFKGSKEAPTEAEGESAAECLKVGQALVEGEHITPENLAQALGQANGDLLQFADVVLGRYSVGRAELAVAISQATNVPAVDTKGIEIPEEIKGILPEEVVRTQCAVAVAAEGNTLVVLCSDPAPARRAAIEAAAARPVKFFVSDPLTVRTFIDQVYRADADVERLVKSLELGDDQAKIAAVAAEVKLDDQAPVIQLVNRIVSQAMRDRASDIHLEPQDEEVRVRFRIDGHLVEAFFLPMGAHAALTSRLKIMSGMNIVEKRRPQDGQFSTVIDGKEVDVRVASVATVFGEKIVMRILDKSRSMIGLSELGFPRETYLHYSKMIHSPFGMVICAGPTGAGKTTTLYASLLEVNSSGKNITTVEDPVEYVFPGINQIQTNDQAGLTFATGLKAILRQDPDVILVGEIRDADTARIAVQSALTGHLVLSSLHGTDSVAALHRFLDMGIEAFLIASSVVGVIGQRLLRRVCDSCKEPYTPGADELAVFRQNSGGSEKATFYRGAGCNFCAGTGYRDRIGVYELLRITPELRRLIVGWATTEELRRLAVAQGMRTMLREAMTLVEADVTTIPEVVKTLFAS
ncbi:MAG: Flp pilus assembly complex ATPase component TadA [Actinobacteria bacterium]|nr:Flp pilus assembly complex ATPase component TadA [Actinomycetota bacterium]